MQNTNNSRDMQVTVRLAAIAIVGLLLFGGLGWLRYDLGKDAFYTVLAVLFGIGLTLVVASITGVGFRLAQRSDNVEIGWLGVYRGVVEAQAAERRAQIEELKLYNQQMLAQAQKPQALPMFDDDDDDEPFFIAADSADAWVGGGR